MPKRKSTENKDSRFVQGGTTTIHPNRLGWWDRRTFEKADDDIIINIAAKYANRPDLMAFDLYGKASYMWIVLQYNNIIDINDEFVQGKEIRLPSPARVAFEFLVNTPGGIVV